MAISLRKAQDVMLYAPEQDCVVTVSPPGCGKDATWLAAAARANAVAISIYTATMEAVDSRGVPYVDDSGELKMMQWAAPNFLPLEAFADKYPKDREIWLNFTDLFQSPPAVQRAMVRSIYGDGLDRRVGDFPILKRLRIFANGNREQDRAGVYRPETYVNDRISYIEIEPDVDEYVSGALFGFPKPAVDEGYMFDVRPRINREVAEGIPDSLLAFVKFNKSVSEFNADHRSFLSPRSIERLGRFIRAFDAAGVGADCLAEIANGTIGEANAMKFMAFHKMRDQLPDVDAILKGEDVPLPPKSEVLFILSTSLLRAAKPEHTDAIVKYLNALRDLQGKDGMPVGIEVSVYMARECLHGAGKGLVGIQAKKEFIRWMEKTGKYLPS